MKYVALIPARGGSKRVPRKNLQQVGGVSLVERAIRCAQETLGGKFFAAVYVSTDDAEIAEVSSNAGAVVIDRPAELAQDDTTMEAVVIHFINAVPLDHGDVIILLEPTAPLRTFWDILQVAGILDNLSAARIVSARTSGCHGFEYFDTGLASAIKVGPFRWTAEHFPETVCLFPEGTRLLHSGDERAIDVDTYADLERARALA